jgi:hypothetical protein
MNVPQPNVPVPMTLDDFIRENSKVHHCEIYIYESFKIFITSRIVLWSKLMGVATVLLIQISNCVHRRILYSSAKTKTSETMWEQFNLPVASMHRQYLLAYRRIS